MACSLHFKQPPHLPLPQHFAMLERLQLFHFAQKSDQQPGVLVDAQPEPENRASRTSQRARFRP
jgi:hypothetical protein